MYEIWIKIKKKIDDKECQEKYSTLLNTDQQDFVLEICYLERCDWMQLLQSHRSR